MSEQQADYDTDDAQPTPGAWVRRYPEELDPLVHAESGEFLVVCKATEVPLKEAVANARLIAAAGTAASKLSEEYDPVAVVEALPSLITVLQSVERADATKKEELIMAQNHAKQLLDTLRTDAAASEATVLDTTQTDD